MLVKKVHDVIVLFNETVISEDCSIIKEQTKLVLEWRNGSKIPLPSTIANYPSPKSFSPASSQLGLANSSNLTTFLCFMTAFLKWAVLLCKEFFSCRNRSSPVINRDIIKQFQKHSCSKIKQTWAKFLSA